VTDGDTRDTTSSTRAAAIAFAVAAVAAVPWYLWIGRHNYFWFDEWDFLAGRSLSSPDDLLRAHNEHWSTIPIIAYRICWWAFGLRTYTPYLLMVVVAHVATAVLLWVMMRRADVNAWIAAAAAGLFLYLGTGFSNIVWAFQIGFVGSLAFGIAHLLLSDHEGPFDRRDAAGLLCGFAGLMCSGVAVTLVAVVGLSVLLRRGWRMALLHVGPLAVVFGIWFLTYGHDTYQPMRPTPGEFLEFVRIMLWHAASSVATYGILAIALLVVLVAGTAIWLADERPRSSRSFAPLALLGGALLFTMITGVGRANNPILSVDESAKASRYVHLLGAMSIPAIAVAADALVRRSRSAIALPAVTLLLLAGIPGNIASIADADTIDERLLRSNPDMVETLPTVETANEVPARVEPDRLSLPTVTNGWLRAGRRSGRIPDPDRVLPQIATVARLRLSIEQVEVAAAPTRCRPLTKPRRVRLQRGEHIRFSGGSITVEFAERRGARARTSFHPVMGTQLVVRVDQLTVRLSSDDPDTLRCR
jgi:hypothetical protein